TPYFLEKGNLWFEEHKEEILRARRTQPFFQDQTEYLERDRSLALSHLLRRLDELGYEKVFEVSYPGEFSHQGGSIDVFPVNSFCAWRVEFLGNRVESILQLSPRVEDEEKAKEILKKRLKSQKIFSDLKGLRPGDYLVHLDHGVARFSGKEQIGKQNYYILQYASEDKLFVPEGLERKLSRYVGFGEPKISRLSSAVWFKTKRKIREEVEALARQLLSLYAQRETTLRKPYQTESELEEGLRETFPYQETPDQLQAIEEIKKDLHEEKPMDRLVVGDVGFGKTEIALRVMALAVENGTQAALLAPTTLLAYQHAQTFLSRLQNSPVRVALLSRLQTEQEQKKILEGLRTGTVDIVVGTHRLLSSDVSFKNLGLLVIDDEQRFGVKQKEKLREIRTNLDVLR
ncbi:MAG: CarD family transcriptional regulator, partial [bacterium]|nr:CarD family transcriptional regulator [bacterium]